MLSWKVQPNLLFHQRNKMNTKFCVLCFFCIWCIQISYQKPEQCLKSPEPGLCMARIPRLYYDPATNSCKEFFYGGCGGNDNNFETIKDCDDICVSEVQTIALGDRCALRPETGVCKASHQRLYYDTDTNTCKVFTYGGCGGNDNNFETIDLCQKSCVKNTTGEAGRCSLKPETGMCKAMIPRLYYDSDSNTCKEFVYGGCGGNGNNFETVSECDQACVSMSKADFCYLDKAEGPCKQQIARLYYDFGANRCKEFTYGGCGGNGNNFETYEKCESTCIQSASDNVCALKAETGHCRGMIFRFYFNSTTQKCGEFIYGGCGGNENNFATEDECELKCGNHAVISTLTDFAILIVCLPLILTKLW